MAKDTYSFRLRSSLRDQLAEEAFRERRSATNMLELILEQRYGEGRMVSLLGFELFPDRITTISDLRRLGEEIASHADVLDGS